MLHLSSLQLCGRRGILSSIDPPMISAWSSFRTPIGHPAPLHCPPTPNKTQATEDFTSTSEYLGMAARLCLACFRGRWLIRIASGLLHGTSSIWVCLKIRHDPIPMDYQTSPQFGKAISQEIQTEIHPLRDVFFFLLFSSNLQLAAWCSVTSLRDLKSPGSSESSTSRRENCLIFATWNPGNPGAIGAPGEHQKSWDL